MLDRCDRVQIAVHDAAKAAHPKELHGLPLGMSRTGLAWDWSGRGELVPSV